jgi:hypothetical protein
MYDADIMELHAFILKKYESEKIRRHGISKKMLAEDQTGKGTWSSCWVKVSLCLCCYVGVTEIQIQVLFS